MWAMIRSGNGAEKAGMMSTGSPAGSWSATSLAMRRMAGSCWLIRRGVKALATIRR
nr:hypothetical protein CPGR_00190 [Mycolicibacter nonchromogenicus]